MQPIALLPSLPFLGQKSRVQTTNDSQAWAEAVCATTPVRICEPLHTNKNFRIDSAVLNLGDILIVSTLGSPIQLVTELHHSAQLLIPYQGVGSWRVERDVYENLTGESILYLPQAPLMLENDVTSGVALNFNPTQLIRTAMTMAGPTGLTAHRLMVFGQPRKLFLTDPITRPLIQGLYTMLQSIDQLSASLPFSETMLRLDDVLTRMAVLLLLPELIQNPSTDATPGTALSARRRLQPLLDWIDANLTRTLGLTDLEAQAQMSRRNLQYTFRRAYDCTPMQWLRRRRLDLAMQRLKQSDNGKTMTMISRELGFVNVASFSREFRRHFGCAPSSVRGGIE